MLVKLMEQAIIEDQYFAFMWGEHYLLRRKLSHHLLVGEMVRMHQPIFEILKSNMNSALANILVR
ncbi:hypothetical protein BJL95_08120 [Methylomonas sp. LWB]|nr:hypothetical protein BJL95_08120 [Methylomonas sp. LWB]